MAPIVRSLGKQIARQLRDDITSGRLREGEPLREIELSKRFGTSRGPIRDALLELTNEGMLVAQQRGGVSVAPAVSDEIHKLVTPIRQTIETYALGLVIDGLTDGDLAHWQSLLDLLYLACRRGDHGQVAEADIAFHRAIIERAGNHSLVTIWSTIVGQLRRHFADTCRHYPDLLAYHAEHITLLDAIRSKKRNHAIRALKEHIRWPVGHEAALEPRGNAS